MTTKPKRAPARLKPTQASPEETPSAGQRGRVPKTVREIGIVLVGVLLALLGEQAVDSLQWQRKTNTAEQNIRLNLEGIRAYAKERLEKTRCADAYLAGMERAILTHDTALARKLQAYQIPAGDTLAVPLPHRPWPLESWNAAQVGQIIDHIGPDRYADYSYVATTVTTLRTLNDQQASDIAIVGTATYSLPADPAVTAQQLAALSRLRASEITMRRVAQVNLDRSAEMGIEGVTGSRAIERGVARCNALLLTGD